MTGTILAQFINFYATLYISKNYSVQQFGVYSSLIAFAVIVSVIISCRFEINIILPQKKQEAEYVLLIGQLLSVIIGSFLIAILWIMPEELINTVNTAKEKKLLYLAVALGFGYSILALAYSWMNRIMAYKASAFLKVLQSLIFLLFLIAANNIDNNKELLWIQFLATSLFCIIIAFCLPKIKKIRWKIVFKLLNKYIKISKYTFSATLIDNLTMQIPILLIGNLFGASQAGHYGMAWRFLALPSAIIGVAAGQIFFQKLSTIWPSKIESKNLLINTWKILAAVGVLPSIIIVLYGEDIFSIILGDEWADSGKIASILIPMIMVSLIHSPTSTAAIVLGLQKKMLYFSIAILITRPFSFFFGWILNDLYVALHLFVLSEIIIYFIYQRWIYKNIVK